MTFLLDTNVVSELALPAPNANVIAWIDARQTAELHFSVATISEIDFGIARLESGARKTRLAAWRDELVFRAGDRVLVVDLAVGTAWALLRARSMSLGRPMPLVDALLAATAEVHGLTIVTRNVRDFEAWGGPVLNPWAGAAA